MMKTNVGILLLLTNFLHSATSIQKSANARTDRSSSTDLCSSIIAIALTRDIDATPTKLIAEPAVKLLEQEPEELPEEFLCECSTTGEYLPLIASDEQLSFLRGALHQGRLVSGVSTLVGVTEEDLVTVGYIVGRESETLVALPDGELEIKEGGTNVRRAMEIANHQEQEAVGNIPASSSSRRGLAVYSGTKKVLFVKVIDRNGLAHPDTPSTMSDRIFGTNGDGTTVKEQIEACSFGDMKLTNNYGSYSLGNAEAAPGVIEVDINVDIKTSSRSQILSAMIKAAEAKLGRSLPELFDHVMFSVEGCYGDDCGWAAYASINGWLSVYNMNYYKAPAVAMHELGHNFNLAHSGGDDGKPHTDHSCLMGNPWYTDDVSAMCFNPAKSFQLSQQGSWYSDRIRTWNSGNSQHKALTLNIVGIADYGNNPNNLPVIVKLETDTSTDIFVGFNRVRGINARSKDAIDQVTVVEQGGDGNSFSTSVMLAMLSSGESYTIDDWQGSGKNMVIEVKSIDKGQNPWVAEVEFNFDPPPTTRPTPKPTVRPSNNPTNLPSIAPTSEPTNRCGSGVCDIDESSSTCPLDCENIAYNAAENANKAAEGMMFFVKARRDIIVTSFDIYGLSTNASPFQVYAKLNSFEGYEGKGQEWNLIYDNPSLQQNGRYTLTSLGGLTSGMIIPAGSVASFYLFTPTRIMYTAGEDELGLYSQNDALEFYEGIGVTGGLFAGGDPVNIYAPRVFSGFIRYDVTEGSPPASSPLTAAPTSLSPSNQPVGLCENSVCDPLEDSSSCPSDCADLVFRANDIGAKGAQGTMFFIKALGRNITLKSIDFFTSKEETSMVQVYTRWGDFRGFEASAAGWDIIYIASVSQLGRSNPTSIGGFDTNVVIPESSVRSFLIYTPTIIMYRQGSNDTSEGSLYSSDGTVELYEGIGLSGLPFSWTPYSPRVFRGSITYDVIGSLTMAQSPTVNPSSYPTNRPSTSPSTKPSAMPSISPSNRPSTHPSGSPSTRPTSRSPSTLPSARPSVSPSISPSTSPSTNPINSQSTLPSASPSISPSTSPSGRPSVFPTTSPSVFPSSGPSIQLSKSPFILPSIPPSTSPSVSPSTNPSHSPGNSPSMGPSNTPTISPSFSPMNPSSQSPIHSPTSCIVKKVKIVSTTSQPLHMFEVQVFSNGVNAALLGAARQSSDYKNNPAKFGANRSIDGDTTTFSHTEGIIGSWWEVNWETAAHMQNIEVLNRYCRDSTDPNGCLCRLSNAELKVYDEVGGLLASSNLGNTCNHVLVSTTFNECVATTSPSTTSLSHAPTQSPSRLSSPYTAKKVKIQSTTLQPLHMFEVQVNSNDKNVALEGKSSQSSTYKNADRFASSQAHDGFNTTFSHTEVEPNAYWQIELHKPFDIESIVILNRWCKNENDPNDCLCRLSNATITLYDQNDLLLTTRDIGNTCDQGTISEVFTTSDTTLDCTLRIESTTGEQLQLFEVQVYSSGKNVALQGFASQSSTFKNLAKFQASNSVDGFNSTFSHTDDSNAFWEVNFSRTADIEQVVILNRWCQNEADPKGCLCRLSNARLIFIEDDVTVATKAIGNTCNQLLVSSSWSLTHS